MFPYTRDVQDARVSSSLLMKTGTTPCLVSPKPDMSIPMTKREAENNRRVELLIQDFDHYLSAFNAEPAFKKTGQLDNHVATITRRRELGTAEAALRDAAFLKLLYQTLKSWGIGQRGSNLLKFDDFVEAIRRSEPAITSLEAYRLDDSSLERTTTDKLWNLINSLTIVENKAKLVPCTKALHHLLPELFVPIDRAFTRLFFGWHVPEFQNQQKKFFYNAHEQFAMIAQGANPAQFIGSGWRTSLTKNIDNALVGFCRVEQLPVLS